MKKLILIALLLVGCSMPEKKLTIIAHRGASGHLPEHTLPSATLAHSFNVDYIEPDLVVTKDDQLIVLHDLYLDTTTNVAALYPKRKRKDGRYYAIDFTLTEIKRLQVYERFDTDTLKSIYPDRFPNRVSGFQVPSFEEFIILVQSLNRTLGKNIGIYPETKRPEFHAKEGKDITKLTINMLREYGYEETKNVYVQSFFPDNLKRLKSEFKTEIPLIQLIGENSWKESSADYDYLLSDEGLKEIATYAKGIGPTLNQVMKDSTLIRRAQEKGLLVHAYTHRSDVIPEGYNRESYLKLIKETLGLDGIFSDFSNQF